MLEAVAMTTRGRASDFAYERARGLIPVTRR
jgi:hypothetical protein